MTASISSMTCLCLRKHSTSRQGVLNDTTIERPRLTQEVRGKAGAASQTRGRSELTLSRADCLTSTRG